MDFRLDDPSFVGAEARGDTVTLRYNAETAEDLGTRMDLAEWVCNPGVMGSVFGKGGRVVIVAANEGGAEVARHELGPADC